MRNHNITAAPKGANTKRKARPARIRGRRYLLFDDDPEAEKPHVVGIGRCREWLLLYGYRCLAFPCVIEVCAADATEMVREGIATNDVTVSQLARGVGCSRTLALRVLRRMVEEAASRVPK